MLDHIDSSYVHVDLLILYADGHFEFLLCSEVVFDLYHDDHISFLQRKRSII